MSSPEQFLPTWLLWTFVLIGYLFCLNITLKGIWAVLKPVFQEARTRDKRIELASAIVAVIALFISGLGFLYTVRQVDAVTDRIAILERAVEGMKPKSDLPKAE